MCGICGVVQIGGAPRRVIEPDVLDRMTDAMTHRGPNDRGTYQADGVAFGVRRLSIVDVAAGHQPFANEDGSIWGMQNGELYNHDEIRGDLRRDGHVFGTRCDTEILPHLYERDGDRLAERLRGKFSIAVWDGRRRRAVIARDPLGVKPLYYAVAGDLVVFASELKSLLASGLITTELDYEAIETYLTLGYVPAPRTPLRNVSKLLPGHRIVAGPSGLETSAYWRYPHPQPDAERRTEEEWTSELLERLDEAVRLRLMSDVPLGAMLSGGLDSSLVVALMARHMSEPVKTFSVGFVEAGDANELADAQLVADALGADHHPLELSLAEQRVDLAELTWSMDEPVADLSSLGFLALSELASRHVTVALSGQGADELLGGYLKHKAASLAQRLPRPLAVAAGTMGRHGPQRLRRTSRTLLAGNAADRVLAMSSKLDDGVRRSLARGPLGVLDGGSALRAIREKANGVRSDALAETLFLDAQLALPDDMLHYFDRASMAHSLEVRVPFLDHHLVEFCARIPSNLKVKRLTGKHILREAARGLVPERVLEKKKVGFFRNSVSMWLEQQATGEIEDWLLAPEPRYAEFLDVALVQRMVRDHVSGSDTSSTYLLLAILMLEVWLSSFVPRATGAGRLDAVPA